MAASHDSSAPPAAPDDAKKGSLRALKAVNFFIADVQNGMGPYMALFLQSSVHWGPAQIGSALAAGNIAQVLAQTPAGALTDNLRQKRALLIVGIALIMTGMLGTAFFTVRPVVMGGQALVGIAGAIFPPCLAAIALGLVRRQRFDQVQGTNQAFNAGGNMFAALALGAIGYYLSLRWMFFLVALLGLGAIISILRIKADDIDFNAARGGEESAATGGEQCHTPPPAPAGGVWHTIKDVFACLGDLLKQPPVRVFLVAAVIFHFANAAMVPLVTQLLARGVGAK
ncbi:MFS transporter [Hymenobacter sp. BT559]|uniref:MFS transporter n=1 Tax=Hymenobacter sp. BT559 TaxID=2795729 RepID=UPI0018EA53FF|nr:MFS transporter [Hymenobacter sp. BT559]MBJ6146197.1 MFS transporter [Hymenobacter sp. BT559]